MPESPAVDQILVPLADAMRMLGGLSRSSVYRLLGARALRARKCGDRLLIETASMRRYIDGLPEARIRTGRCRPAA